MRRLLPIISEGDRGVAAMPWMAEALCTHADLSDALWRQGAAGAGDTEAALCTRCPVRRDCASHEVVEESKDRTWDGPGRLDWELRNERRRRAPGPSFQARVATR
jgi:hypothetical protein